MTAPGASGAAGGGDGRVPITTLGVQELSRLREQLQADVDHLVESHGMLGRLAARSEAAAKAVSTLRDSKPGVREVASHNARGSAWRACWSTPPSSLWVCLRGSSSVASNRCQPPVRSTDHPCRSGRVPPHHPTQTSRCCCR
jgi:hypothetical protein